MIDSGCGRKGVWHKLGRLESGFDRKGVQKSRCYSNAGVVKCRCHRNMNAID